jgi:hypothetical protein
VERHSVARLLIVITVALTACSASATQTGLPTAEATLTQTAEPTEEPTPEPTPTPESTPNQATWEADAVEHREAVGERFTYPCAPLGQPSVVWGTDIYTDDSSVCTAAVHAGVITFAEGGVVTIEMLPGQASYPGTTRNGFESHSWGSWVGSFVFITT